MKKTTEDPFPTAVLIVVVGLLVFIPVSTSFRDTVRDLVFGFFVLAIIMMLEKISDNGKT